MILVIYCAGGFGKEVYDIAHRINQKNKTWGKIIFSDDTLPNNEKVYLSRNYSFSTILNDFDLNTISFVVANGEPHNRKKILDRLNQFELKLETLIDPSAIISSSAKIGKGTIVCQYSTITSLAKIEDNVVCNIGSIIGHDVVIGNHSNISSYSVIGGKTKIGSRVFLGSGSILKEKIKIGNDVIISMGSVVYKDIEDGLIVVGNPARISRRNEKKNIF
ncbi:MAG: acetyltransferase [Candidatus Neomarinimicrobiota bacterium]